MNEGEFIVGGYIECIKISGILLFSLLALLEALKLTCYKGEIDQKTLRYVPKNKYELFKNSISVLKRKEKLTGPLNFVLINTSNRFVCDNNLIIFLHSLQSQSYFAFFSS